MPVLQSGPTGSRFQESRSSEPTEPDQGRLALRHARGAIEFRNVSFAYDAQKGDVLQDISFSIAPGQTVALVGRSGSGKTTLAHLLLRFYDPREGAVCLDGEDIRNYRLADLRGQIAMVGQDVMLFNETIAHNIAYGRFAIGAYNINNMEQGLAIMNAAADHWGRATGLIQDNHVITIEVQWADLSDANMTLGLHTNLDGGAVPRPTSARAVSMSDPLEAFSAC